jgi:hypothetical protein
LGKIKYRNSNGIDPACLLGAKPNFERTDQIYGYNCYLSVRYALPSSVVMQVVMYFFPCFGEKMD